MDRYTTAFVKFHEKHGREPLLLEKFNGSCTDYLKGHWVSSRTPRVILRNNNGRESCAQKFEQTVTKKSLITVKFL